MNNAPRYIRITAIDAFHLIAGGRNKILKAEKASRAGYTDLTIRKHNGVASADPFDNPSPHRFFRILKTILPR
jgi:hypothetical protein